MMFWRHTANYSQIFLKKCLVVALLCTFTDIGYHFINNDMSISIGSVLTPIVGSTFGGWGIEADKHHKRIATLIANKRKEDYADVVNHIRTRLRFSVLKSILIAVRGVRGKMRQDAPLSTISFNLIEH